MSSTSSLIKANNHRVHPCTSERKIALIKAIISKNTDKEIIIVTSMDTKIIEDEISYENVKIFNDKTLIQDDSIKCELLISFDLPAKAVIYIARLSHTTSHAVLILNKSEQNLLYSIETLLGRVIKQEIIEGYEEVKEIKKEDSYPRKKALTKDQIKEVAKQRYESSTQEPKEKSYDDKKTYDNKTKDNRWDKKKKEANKYLGKDENGKAIFSGKSGDRNHSYDGTPKDKYDKPIKKGRTINIKALKKKTDSK